MNLHPSRVSGIQPAVESDSVIDVRAQWAGDVDDGHAQRGTGGSPLQVVIAELATHNIQIGATHVRVNQQSQVRRVHVTREIRLVHLHKVVVALLCTLKMLCLIF